MQYGRFIAFVVIYYFIITLVIGGATSLTYYYDEDEASDYDIDWTIFEYSEVEDFYEYIESQFIGMSYDQWRDGEQKLSDRVEIGPVFALNRSVPDYPDGNWIFEEGSVGSWLSKYFGWTPWVPSGRWRPEYYYWDYEDRHNMSYGEQVYLYPHILYNSPGGYLSSDLDPFDATTHQFILVWGFDASRGQVFREFYDPFSNENISGINFDEVTTPFRMSYIYKFYAGEMPNTDLLYVIDAMVVSEEGLVSAIANAFFDGLTYNEIENLFNTELRLEERYMGRIVGDSGPPDEYYMVGTGNVPWSENEGRYQGIVDYLRDTVKGIASMTSPDSPLPVRVVTYGLFIGPFVLIIAYIGITLFFKTLPSIISGR